MIIPALVISTIRIYSLRDSPTNGVILAGRVDEGIEQCKGIIAVVGHEDIQPFVGCLCQRACRSDIDFSFVYLD